MHHLPGNPSISPKRTPISASQSEASSDASWPPTSPSTAPRRRSSREGHRRRAFPKCRHSEARHAGTDLIVGPIQSGEVLQRFAVSYSTIDPLLVCFAGCVLILVQTRIVRAVYETSTTAPFFTGLNRAGATRTLVVFGVREFWDSAG